MKKNLLIVFVLVLAIGCKKRGNDDVVLHKWKRDLYRAPFTNEGSATLNSSDPRINNSIYMNTDFVVLTEA